MQRVLIVDVNVNDQSTRMSTNTRHENFFFQNYVYDYEKVFNYSFSPQNGPL